MTTTTDLRLYRVAIHYTASKTKDNGREWQTTIATHYDVIAVDADHAYDAASIYYNASCKVSEFKRTLHRMYVSHAATISPGIVHWNRMPKPVTI